jgi:hypothetical protein
VQIAVTESGGGGANEYFTRSRISDDNFFDV